MDFDDVFGTPASSCATFLMLSELALQDLTSSDRSVFPEQRLEAQRLLESALAALASVEHEIEPPSDTRRTKRSPGSSKTPLDPTHGAEQKRRPSVPESPQQLLERLQTVALQVTAMLPRDAKKAWSLASEVKQIRDGLGRLARQRRT